MSRRDEAEELLQYALNSIRSSYKGRQEKPFNESEVKFIKQAVEILKCHEKHDLRDSLLKSSLSEQLQRCEAVLRSNTPQPTQIYSLGLNRFILGEYETEWRSCPEYYDFHRLWTCLHRFMSGQNEIIKESE